MHVPLHSMKDWSPFRLDALGLVTLLGAEEVCNAVGALEHSRYTEYLPLFGTYLIAENRFTRPVPGFALYNISDGVHIPIVNGWFSRWLMANLSDKITILDWEVSPRKRRFNAKQLLSGGIGIFANGALIAIAALQADFYGLANAIAMVLSVMVRLMMVHENRKHLNMIVESYLSWDSRVPFLQPNQEKNCVKIVITAPEDKVVVFRMQRGLVNCIVNDLDVVNKATGARRVLSVTSLESPNSATSNDDAELALKSHISSNAPSGLHSAPVDSISHPSTIEGISVLEETSTSGNLEPASKEKSPAEEHERRTEITISLNTNKVFHTQRYTFARGLGWVTFAIHVICIGQSNLLTQILSVALLISSTILRIYNVGNENPEVGDRLSIRKSYSLETHKDAYLYLQPTPEEERILRQYLRLPYRPGNESAMGGPGSWSSSWWSKWDDRLGKTKST